MGVRVQQTDFLQLGMVQSNAGHTARAGMGTVLIYVLRMHDSVPVHIYGV